MWGLVGKSDYMIDDPPTITDKRQCRSREPDSDSTSRLVPTGTD